MYVLEQDGLVIAFYSLVTRPSATFLEHLFVAPDAVGKGAGALLLEHALATARGLGCRRLSIESDPHAEGFYLREGAHRVGTAASIVPGRVLPLLEIDVHRDTSA